MPLVPKLPPNTCPQCKRSMRPHCPKVACRWVYCGMCVLTRDLRTGNSFGRFTGLVDT